MAKFSPARPVDRPPMTPEGIVEAATRMSESHGLQGWGIRALAAELGVWPTVIYHHVGDREALMEAVTERVVRDMPCPPPDAPWREWFTKLLVEGRAVVRRCPGVARKLVFQGATVPAALRIIDTGVRVLRAAGFGDEAPVVFSMLVNGAFLLVALDDDHDLEPSAHQRAAAILTAYRGDTERPGLAAMGDYVSGSETDAEHVHDFNEEFYLYHIQRLLDGAQARLDALSEGEQP